MSETLPHVRRAGKHTFDHVQAPLERLRDGVDALEEELAQQPAPMTPRSDADAMSVLGSPGAGELARQLSLTPHASPAVDALADEDDSAVVRNAHGVPVGRLQSGAACAPAQHCKQDAQCCAGADLIVGPMGIEAVPQQAPQDSRRLSLTDTAVSAGVSQHLGGELAGALPLTPPPLSAACRPDVAERPREGASKTQLVASALEAVSRLASPLEIDITGEAAMPALLCPRAESARLTQRLRGPTRSAAQPQTRCRAPRRAAASRLMRSQHSRIMLTQPTARCCMLAMEGAARRLGRTAGGPHAQQ